MGVFLVVSNTPYPQGMGYQHANNSWTLSMCTHGMRSSNQILRGNQTIREKILQVNHTTFIGQKFFVTFMLTCDAFAVANLRVFICDSVSLYCTMLYILMCTCILLWI